MAVRRDIKVFRGNNEPWIFRLKTEDEDGVRTAVDLTGSTVELKMSWPNGSLVASGLVVDAPAGEITWTPTPIQTRLFPKGKVADFELQVTDVGGTQKTWLYGKIDAIGEGINSD